jgi:hypothetical protein
VFRTVLPELLDTLPPDHPDALHNRRDLRLINAIMGNFRWIRQTLQSRRRPGEPVLEIGAGTGEMGLTLADGVERYAGLDLWPRPAEWPEHLAWHQHDLRLFPHYADYPVVLANLILHQFRDDELAALGALLTSSTRLIIACEPARCRRNQWVFRAIAPLLGANHISLHDARTSIQAGFLGNELPQLLGLEPARWECTCSTGALGSYRMIAVRRPGP